MFLCLFDTTQHVGHVAELLSRLNLQLPPGGENEQEDLKVDVRLSQAFPPLLCEYNTQPELPSFNFPLAIILHSLPHNVTSICFFYTCSAFFVPSQLPYTESAAPPPPTGVILQPDNG